MKFIGELFKQKLLSERIIHECIKGLFDDIQKQRDDREMMEAYTELLCKLMSTIGKLIDTPEAKEYMVRNHYRDINIPIIPIIPSFH